MFSFDSSFYITKTTTTKKKKQKKQTKKTNISTEEKIHSGLFLSLAVTGIDVNDIIRYPSSSLKYYLTSFITVSKKNNNIKA